MTANRVVRVFLAFSLALLAGTGVARAQGAPVAPSNLTGTAASATEMNLQWTDNSLDETGFRVERGLDGAVFEPLGTVAADVTAYPDLTVVGDVRYYYRVIAVGAGGDSKPSNVYAGFTADTVAPPAPLLSSPFNGDQLDTNSVKFEWAPVADLSDCTYRIQVADMDTGIVIHDIGGITGTTITLPCFDSRYMWHVTATDAANNTGEAAPDWYCLVAATDPVAPDTTVTAPNGGEVLQGGSLYPITWYALDPWNTSTPNLKIRIYFSSNHGRGWEQIASRDRNLGAFAWRVPNISCEEACLIRVTTRNEAGMVGLDDSDYAFSIQAAVQAIAPNGGEVWRRGSARTIRWTSAGPGGPVAIRLLRGRTLARLITGRTANDGSFAWRVPYDLPAADNYRVRVTRPGISAAASDASDRVFSIR